MEVAFYLLGSLAMVLLQIAAIEVMFQRGLRLRRFAGDSLRSPGNLEARLLFTEYEPIADIPEKMIELYRRAMVVLVSVFVLLSSLAIALSVVGYPQAVWAAVVCAAIVQGVWVLVNMFGSYGSISNSITTLRDSPEWFVSYMAYRRLNENYVSDHRPRNWPKEMMDALHQPGNNDDFAGSYASLRFTYANDFGDEVVRAESIADAQRTANPTSPASEDTRNHLAAIIAFDAYSRGERSEGDKWFETITNDPEQGDPWFDIALAHRHKSHGDEPAAIDLLDKVWYEVTADSSQEIHDYVLEQNRRIVPRYDPPEEIASDL